MLLTHLTSQLNTLAARWDEERAAITTPAQLLERNRLVRARMREMMHGMPERTPLNPEIVGRFSRPGYRVETVLFQSRPDFWVPATLYIPQGAGPFPGIISPCGHYADARIQPSYQAAYQTMAHSGLVVLAFDPVGQGERRQYWDPLTGETEVGGATTEHSMAGQQLLLMGEDLTQYRVWDGIRAIDYLLTRPEVDASRIGCAGHSGGGTLTMFISAIDERVQCAVISQGGTAHRWPIDLRPESRIGPSDVEQNLFPAAVHGVDLCDMHVAIAPRPLLALIENYNPRFDKAAAHVRERYKLLGVEEKFATEEATDPHAWTSKLRLAAARWFSHWFLGRPGPDREPEIQVEEPETLYTVPGGSLRWAGRGDLVNQRIARRQRTLPPHPDRPTDPAVLARLLRYRRPDGALDSRIETTTPRRGYRIEKVEFLSEPGIYIPAWVFLPERPTDGRTLLYVHEGGKQADGMEFGRLERMALAGRTAVAVDVRGIGDTRPRQAPPGERPQPYGFLFNVETAMAYMAWYLDRCLCGMRVQDVVRSVDYALSRGGRQGVEAIGVGAGALWVLLAAVLDPRIESVTCERGLLSYGTLASTDRYVHNASSFVRDILLSFDLPQVAAALAPRELRIVRPVDAMRRPAPAGLVRQTFRAAQDAYSKAGAAAKFQLEI